MIQEQNEVIHLPLWKNVLEEMREEGITYGKVWKADFFETRLRCPRTDQRFDFAMMQIKQAIEIEDGYYLGSFENKAIWKIPESPNHEDVTQGFESKLRRYAIRAINLRSATLCNPAADLTTEQRRRMESNLEKASFRLLLISRQASIVKELQKNSPRLLEQNHKPTKTNEDPKNTMDGNQAAGNGQPANSEAEQSVRGEEPGIQQRTQEGAQERGRVGDDGVRGTPDAQ